MRSARRNNTLFSVVILITCIVFSAPIITALLTERPNYEVHGGEELVENSSPCREFTGVESDDNASQDSSVSSEDQNVVSQPSGLFSRNQSPMSTPISHSMLAKFRG